MSKQKEHLLRSLRATAGACLPGSDSKKAVHWQPGPEALTKGGEIEGQVRVGAPAPEGDAVQGALHSVSVVTRTGGPGGGYVGAGNPGSRLSPSAPRLCLPGGRDPGPAAQRLGTAGRASP